jgi:hypothetical protein
MMCVFVQGMFAMELGFLNMRDHSRQKILLKLLRIEWQIIPSIHDNGNIINRTSMGTSLFNRIPVIRVFAVRVTLIFTSKKHALNSLKMGPLLRSNVMLS